MTINPSSETITTHSDHGPGMSDIDRRRFRAAPLDMSMSLPFSVTTDMTAAAIAGDGEDEIVLDCLVVSNRPCHGDDELHLASPLDYGKFE